MQEVSEKMFEDLLQKRLGASWDRALALFRNCGTGLSFDVANVLLHAVQQGKVEEVLGILEQHYEEHLQYQHPDIRGTVCGGLGENKTPEVFLRICTETLGLAVAQK